MSAELRTRYCSRCLTTFTGDPEVCPNMGCRSRRRREGWGELLDPGDLLDRRYRVEKNLAIGGAGVTYLAQEEGEDGKATGPRLAIKVLYAHRDSGHYLRRLATEAQILTELDHPSIVEMRGFVHRAGQSPYLITRFEEGGSLLDHLSRVGVMDIRSAAGVGVQLCDALSVAHAKGVIHRDLKPENILLSHVPAPGELPRVRLTDWGIAKVQGGIGESLTRYGTFVGTPQYAAPEQFEGAQPTTATDLFSLGAVLHFCVTLRPLTAQDGSFDPERTLETLREALPPQLVGSADTPQRVSAWDRFLAATMDPDPTLRVSMASARAMLLAIASDQPLPDPLPPLPSAAEVTFEADPVEVLQSLAEQKDKQEASPATAAPSGGEQAPPPVLAPLPVQAPSEPSAQAPAQVPPPVQAVEPSAQAPASPASSAAEPSEKPPASWPSWDNTPPRPAREAAPPPAEPAEAEAEAEPEETEQELVYATGSGSRRWLWAAVGLGLLGTLGLGALGAGWWYAPSKLPAALLPPPSPLRAEDPERESLQREIEALVPEIRSFCELGGVGTVEIKLVIEPSGRLRALEEVRGDLTRSQAACVRDVLRQAQYTREGWKPVRARFRLAL